METAYREWEKKRREPGRHGAAHHSHKNTALGPKEQRRLLQLVVCIALFLVVFIGNGVFPHGLERLRTQLLPAIESDTDFKEAFSNLGRAISQGEPVMDTLGGLWVDVFGGGTVSVSSNGASQYPLSTAELAYLTGSPTIGIRHLAGIETASSVPALALPTPKAMTASPRHSEPSSAPAQSPVVEHMDYSGAPLPENTSMDKYDLGLNITTPALGWVASAFGWREHPVEGGEKFHNGVDLAVNNGTQVLAFADGVVDYIGDNPDVYGQYLQISHPNGVTTFYAHCSKLLVRQGQRVTMGQAVAESGDTGNATGPHLHFEIERNGVRLNPLYYIKTA